MCNDQRHATRRGQKVISSTKISGQVANLEAQEQFFLYHAVLLAIISHNSLRLVLAGYRTIMARYVAKVGYRTDVEKCCIATVKGIFDN